jgi:hypothetical protein
MWDCVLVSEYVRLCARVRVHQNREAAVGAGGGRRAGGRGAALGGLRKVPPLGKHWATTQFSTRTPTYGARESTNG